MATHRIYYDDSFARDFEAKVLTCEPYVHGTTPAWEVVLDETALYPTSGGQPCDHGKLGDANVLDVRDEGDEVVHIVDRELKPGPVHGCVDWPRRFDHMQQHTGQHLLSAMFQERFGRPTVSFHLGAELSSIDLRGAEPTLEILEGAERAANRVIFEDRPINVRYGTQDRNGMLMYYVPLQPGMYKTFGTPFDAFWCCTGTGSEEYAKLNDSIYFHDNDSVYVNLFLPSKLTWKERAFSLRQVSKFPEEERITFTIDSAPSKPIAMKIRRTHGAYMWTLRSA